MFINRILYSSDMYIPVLYFFNMCQSYILNVKWVKRKGYCLDNILKHEEWYYILVRECAYVMEVLSNAWNQ